MTKNGILTSFSFTKCQGEGRCDVASLVMRTRADGRNAEVQGRRSVKVEIFGAHEHQQGRQAIPHFQIAAEK